LAVHPIPFHLIQQHVPLLLPFHSFSFRFSFHFNAMKRELKRKEKRMEGKEGRKCSLCLSSHHSYLLFPVIFTFVNEERWKKRMVMEWNEARILSFIFSLFPFHSFYFNKNIWLNFLVHHYNCWLFIVVLHILLLTFFSLFISYTILIFIEFISRK